MSFNINMNPEMGIPTTSTDYLFGTTNSKPSDNSDTYNTLNINPTILSPI